MPALGWNNFYLIWVMGHQENMLYLYLLKNNLQVIKTTIFADVQQSLRQLTIPEIKGYISCSEPDILDLLMKLSLSSEDYKICEAVRQALAEKPV